MVEPRAGRVGKMRGFRRADGVLHRLGPVRDLVGDLLQFRPCADHTCDGVHIGDGDGLDTEE
jgi:hypothetical protein